MRVFGLLGLLCLLSTVTTACSDEDAGPSGGSELIQSSVARLAAQPSAGLDAGHAVAELGSDLYGLLSREEGNLVFSPYGAYVALAMAREGARGETAAEMDHVLHSELVLELHAGVNALDQALAQRPGEYPVGDQTVQLELATANQLWGQSGLEFEQAFLDRLAASYGAGMRLVDYIEAREEARQAINAWVAERTRERIPELVPEGVLNELTRLVLVNAIYLKAPWLHPFDEGGTESAPWSRLDGRESEAQLMRLNERLRYVRGDGLQAVELPYVDGLLAMTVIVPDEGEFAAIEQALTSQTLTSTLEAMEGAQVHLRFPRFEFRSKLLLSGRLAELGMPLAFSEAADFSGMTSAERLLIQEVIQEAFVSVDEEGTEAAAATAVVAGATSAPVDVVELTVDRPFVFLIRDVQTGAILFMGRVVDPELS